MTQNPTISIEDIEKLKLNGVTVGEWIPEMVKGYLVKAEKDSTVDPEYLQRQRRITANTDDLEGKIKSILGDSIKLDTKSGDDKQKAVNLAYRLAFEIAKTEGYSEKLEELPHERVSTYLLQASQATGNPTIGNWTDFIESILNMPAVRPGDPLYDRNSPLAALISYVATKKDKPSERLQYIQRLFSQLWQKPGYGLKLNERFSEAFGIPFGPTATANDVFGDINTRAGQEVQRLVSMRPKTYHKNPSGQATYSMN